MKNWAMTMAARPGCQCARRSLLPKVNVAAAMSISHGSRRRKLESEVRTSSSAPASPPARLVTPRAAIHRRDVLMSPRYANVLDSDAGHSASVDVALAATGDTPAKMSAGSVRNDPPPATALSAPPIAAARKSRMGTRGLYNPCVPRNAEVIRQWTILREIEQARAGGVPIDELASQCSVTTRTIRRDLQALEEAGFPIYDDKSRDDGKTRWVLNGQAFKGLSTGLTLAELCALYFSRSLAESLAGTPFKDDVESAFDKLTTALTPHMQRFLDQLPRVLSTKTQPQIAAGASSSSGRTKIEARALEGTLHQRQATITYHSRS